LFQAHWLSSPFCLNAWYAFSKVRWSPSTCENCAFASSASFCWSRGRMNGFGTDSMAVMVRISLAHLNCGETHTIFASCGSNGNSDITVPTCVRFPSSSSAPR